MARVKIGGPRRKTAKRKTSTRRRRRVSGIGKIDIGGSLTNVAEVGAGYIVARVLSNVALSTGIVTSLPVISGAQIAAGVLLPYVIKSKLGQNLGNGMIALGVGGLAVEMGVISGAQPVASYRINGTSNLNVIGRAGAPRRRIAGTSNLQAIGGTSNLNVLGGINNNNRISNPRPNANRTTY
jgi:hypothetical protein